MLFLVDRIGICAQSELLGYDYAAMLCRLAMGGFVERLGSYFLWGSCLPCLMLSQLRAACEGPGCSGYEM